MKPMVSRKDKNFMFTLWLFNIAMEHSPFINGLPIKNGDFPWQTGSHNQMVTIKDWNYI